MRNTCFKIHINPEEVCPLQQKKIPVDDYDKLSIGQHKKLSPPRHSVWTVPTGGGAPFTDVRGGKQLSTLQIKEERETIANVTSAGEQLGQGG